MTPFGLSIAYLIERPLMTALNVMLLALGTATLVTLVLFDAQFRDRIGRDAAGIDIVIGAKGSPLQLILSAVHHVDVPTGNIPLADADLLSTHPMVRAAIPVGLGDSWRGFRVVGTAPRFIPHRGATLAEGRAWEAPFEAVLGATVAARAGIGVGATFESDHGLRAGGPGGHHEDHPFTVVGVLAPTGGVTDRLILTSMESVWEAHEQHAPDVRQVTAVLVSVKSPIAMVTLPRAINETTAMQAAVPVFESARLFALMGVGLDVLRGFGLVLMAGTLLGVLAALTAALERRRRDLALLRALGASRVWIACVLLAEALVSSLTGAVLGAAMGHGALSVLGGTIDQARDLGLTGASVAPMEVWLLLGAIALGPVAAIPPMIRAYRSDVSTMLVVR